MRAMTGFLSLCLAVSMLPGCHRGERASAPTGAPAAGSAPAGAGSGPEEAVQLSEAVKAKWKALEIGVLDATTHRETTYTVKAGSEFAIPGTGLSLRPLALVPDFTMDGGIVTSRSAEARNPAAEVRVTEGGRTLYQGWLFARFPEPHPFAHPRYSLRLVALLPA